MAFLQPCSGSAAQPDPHADLSDDQSRQQFQINRHATVVHVEQERNAIAIAVVLDFMREGVIPQQEFAVCNAVFRVVYHQDYTRVALGIDGHGKAEVVAHDAAKGAPVQRGVLVRCKERQGGE